MANLRRAVGSAWVVASGILYVGACNHGWSALDLVGTSTSGSSGASTGSSSGTGGAATGSTSSSGGQSAASTAASGGGDAGSDGAVEAGVDASADAGVDATADAGVHCGGTDLLSWNFASTLPNLWEDSSAAVVGSNEGVISFPVQTGGYWQQQFGTVRVYDLRGDSVSVKVTQVAAVASNAEVQLTANYDSGDYLFLREYQGSLMCGYGHAGQESASPTPYDPVSAAYWRLSETPGTIHCDTSPDGVTWTEINTVNLSITPLAEPSAIRVQLQVVMNGANTVAGEAHFTDLNGGGTPPGHWCPVSTLTDTFGSAGSPPGAWDRSYATATATITQDGGTLNLVDANGVGPGHISSAAYDLTGERVSVAAVALPTSAEGTAVFQVNNGNAYMRWSLHSDTSYCGYQTATGSGNLWQGTLPPAPAFVGMRESGGRVYCTLLVPGDGGPAVWEDLGSISMGVDVTALDINLSTYSTTGNTSTWGASFKDYNLPPVP